MGHGGHERNNHCFNCHNEQDRETFQVRDGRKLSFGESSQLCGSCHGPTYADWEAGAHGRTSGYWGRTRGPIQRLGCVNCHDPHARASRRASRCRRPPGCRAVEPFPDESARRPRILAKLAEPARAAALAAMRTITAPEGAVLLRQGEVTREVFVVLRGKVAVVREEDGRRNLARAVQAGGQFGRIAALQAIPGAGSAVTQEALHAVAVPVDLLRQREGGRAERHAIDRVIITDRALLMLRGIVQVATIINVFLLVNEVFKEFYSGTHHVASAQYLLFGLHGHSALVPWIWTAIAFNLAGVVLLILPLSRRIVWLDVACVLCIVGIWIEKGMGLVVPGFIPTPLGDIVEYSPASHETIVSLGIWAFGLRVYTVLLRVAVPIVQGRFSRGGADGSAV